MKRKIFTVIAALCSLAVVNAADVNVNANDNLATKIAEAAGSGTVRIEVGTYILPAELTIPAGVTVIGGFKSGFADENRIYPGAATTKADMTILDGNSLVNTKPADKHRVAKVLGTLEGCVIRNGHVRDGNGGGVLVDGGTVQNCIIKGNVAMSVTSNNALGGGAYLTNSGKLINCVVAYNMANNGYGVAGTGEVINNTIVANTYAPFAVAVKGATYKHFKHHIAGTLPWDPTMGDPFSASDDLDTQEITVTDFALAQTQTTTSQYAVFAAAMDFTVASQNVSFSDADFKLADLTDPLKDVTVGTYMGFTSTAGDVLFKESGMTNYGLQLVGTDFIYYSTKANDAMAGVSWYGAVAYSLWLGGSLPTEGQWELAARSNGTETLDTYLYAGSDVLNDVAWYSGAGSIKEVATKAKNGINLYDMSGNVWEWCTDKFDATGNKYPDYTTAAVSSYESTENPINNAKGSNRVRRGGSWNSGNGISSLASRHNNVPAYVDYYNGFRPVLK